jgi:hypothetical protein
MANQGIKRIIIDKDALYIKYIIEGKSILVISKELNCSGPTIHERLKEYGFNRNKSDAQKLKCSREGVHNQFDLDEILVKKLYLIDKLNSYEIAKKLSCSQYKVWKTLNNLGICRTISEVMTNRQLSKETIIKLRLIHIDRISLAHFNGYQVTPFYNKKSIYHIEKYGNENGYMFQHAENGGEFAIKKLGYWVDGYDKNKNVVIEFDEKYHNKQILKDNKRQNEIIEYLKCDFIRLNEDGREILNLKYNGKSRN